MRDNKNKSMDNSDIRWTQRLDNYSRALQQLERGVNLANDRELSDLEEQGLIQAFEFTHELAWKTIKDFLNSKGNSEIYGSKDATRQAFNYGIIDEGEIWMDMIKSRNNSSHTYNDAIAHEIIQAVLTVYYQEFKKLFEQFERLKDIE